MSFAVLFNPLDDLIAGKSCRGCGTRFVFSCSEGVLAIGQLCQCFVHNMRIDDAFTTPAFQYLEKGKKVSSYNAGGCIAFFSRPGSCLGDSAALVCPRAPPTQLSSPSLAQHNQRRMRWYLDHCGVSPLRLGETWRVGTPRTENPKSRGC